MADKKRILVVDDEPQITRVLRTSLNGSGYEVRTANDGHAGLRFAREWQPDLVITDVSMPNMNGIELCQQLRSESVVPIIVLSVKGEEKTKVEALDAGADDYVTKPIGMDELASGTLSCLKTELGYGSCISPTTNRAHSERKQKVLSA